MSSLGSISCRVPILDGEYYIQWKYKMLELFDEFHLSKYVKSPYVPPIDPLHPTHEEEVDMLCNLRTVNLIVRALPRNVLNQMKNFACAYTLWNDLEKQYPNYSLSNLD